MSVYLRKYNVTLDGSTAGSLKIRVPLVRRDETAYLASGDWTPAAGDVKVSKDFGAEANIGTLPTFSNDAWEFVLSGTELTAKVVTVRVNDAAVELFSFTVETFGHASAMWPWDYATANVNQTGDSYPIVSSGAHGNAALKALVDAKASQASVDDLPTNSELATALGGLNDLDATQVQTAAAAALTAYDPPTKAELDSGLAGLNDLDATQVQTAAAAALTAYDPPTKAELDAGFAALNDLSAADVNAEVDQALADYDAPTKAELDAGFAALNDLSAADVNAEVDQALADYDGPTKAELDAGLAGLNDLDSTAVQAAAAAALTAYDPPTKAELDSGLAGLNDLDATEVQAAAAAALAAYDPPTKAELDSGLAGLNDLDSTAVQAAAAAAITAYDPPTRTEATADKDAVIAAIPTVEEIDTELSANHGAGSWEGGGGGGSGTGSEIVTITVQDAASALTKIQGIPVSAFSAGVRQGTDTSAADGTLQLHLNPGTYPLSAPGYGSWEMSDPTQTITVVEGGPNSFTLEMDAIARPDHTDPEKSIAYFTTWDNQGNREGNVPVSAWLKTLPDGTAGNLFDDEPWTVESDDDGDGQFGSNEDGTGLFRGAVYRFRRGDDDDTPVRYWDVTIPDQGSFNLPPIAGSP